ncbi:hypothetical protein NIES4072_69890 [Nostoc commune NIES-4072]|uniref:Uncharacterized protein n=1 Tax=Nostoc commune NIES-4072 TaxID=2005467 RepID=A0A2R5FX08_NOSCO|nr:hypothetical protein [Nostoc commune]BBD70622.1 hypothetical protein NIES4070_70330 [Nostoc commune HK-02]GBG23277.1 hypothetical protein NIES4072_69890 [Nostoc commune NIES-4072]
MSKPIDTGKILNDRVSKQIHVGSMQLMKSLRILAPTFLGLLTLTVTHPVNAQAVIDTLDNGNLSVTGMTRGSGCTVLFNPQGEILQQGRSCNSTEIRKAETAIDSYLREQRTSDNYNSSSSRQNLTLICYGEGRKPTVTNSYGYEWNDRRHRYESSNRIESTTTDFDSEVQVEVRGTEGKIHLGGRLIPPIHSGGDNGWWTLDNLQVSPDKITGKYRLNGLNKPRVNIDRRSGRIAIDGIEKFRGDCNSGDWSNSRTRF